MALRKLLYCCHLHLYGFTPTSMHHLVDHNFLRCNVDMQCKNDLITTVGACKQRLGWMMMMMLTLLDLNSEGGTKKNIYLFILGLFLCCFVNNWRFCTVRVIVSSPGRPMIYALRLSFPSLPFFIILPFSISKHLQTEFYP